MTGNDDREVDRRNIAGNANAPNGPKGGPGFYWLGASRAVLVVGVACMAVGIGATALHSAWRALALAGAALAALSFALLMLRSDASSRAQAALGAGRLQLAESLLRRQVTQRRQAEAVAHGQMRVLRMIATGEPVNDVLAALMHFIEDLAPDVLASVLLLDADGRHLRHGAAPRLPSAYTQAIDGAAIGPSAGSCGTAAYRREAVIVEDVRTDPLWQDYRALADAHGLRACWSTPFFDATGRLLGTFAMYRREPGGPTDHHRWLIDIATQSAAIAISHAAAQAALKGQMEVLHSTLQHMDQGVVILDPELRILSANRRLQALLEFPDDICRPGTAFADAIHFSAQRGEFGSGDSAAIVDEHLAPVVQRQPKQLLRARGNGALLDVRGTPLPDGGYVITYTDIAAHRRTEHEALRFRAAMDLSNDGIYLADVARMRIVDVNNGACRALGYTREELLGQSVEMIFADRTVEQMREQYQHIVDGDDSRANFEALHRRKDGSVFPVEINRRAHHTPDGPLLVGVARDISDRKNAEAALRSSEEMLRVIVEDALDAAVRIDAQGIVIGWNAQAERSFGWSAVEAEGRLLSELVLPPRRHAALRRVLRRFVEGGHGLGFNRRIELSALRRDGTEIPVELSVTPIRTAEGWVFSAFLRDLSAQRASDAARSALEAQLRESQKMEAIGTLAGGIAHDFNNILAAILANAALARDTLASGGPIGGVLEQIQKAAQRARGLVQQILAFGRRQGQRLQPLQLAPLFDEAGALMRALLPAGAALVHQRAAEPVWVMGDSTQLQQVLMNLCTNAWHALRGQPGQIEIGFETAPDATAPSGRHAHLWVRDTGCGMDSATLEHIFEPFFTTKPVGEGTGLGLAVVHGIINSHQGRIRVDSKPGSGSCFHIELPLIDPPAAQAAPALPSDGTAQGQGEHLLVLDDDETMLLVVEQLLARAGYRVTTAQQAQHSLELVRQHAFDLVLTDYNMPGMSGFDVAREIARIHTGLPVVVSSGYVTEAMRAEAQTIGVRAMLRKENTLEELTALVRAVLTRPAEEISR